MNRLHDVVPKSNRNKRKSKLARAQEAMASTSRAGGITAFFKPQPRSVEEPQPKRVARRLVEDDAPSKFETLVTGHCAELVAAAPGYSISAWWNSDDFYPAMAQELAAKVISKWPGFADHKLVFEEEDRTGSVFLHLQFKKVCLPLSSAEILLPYLDRHAYGPF